MKKLSLFKIIIPTIIMALMGCSNNSSTSSDTSGAVTTVPVSLPDYISTANNNTSSVAITLVNVHPDLRDAYAGLDMELNLGTVIGNHNDLDANQGGDITIHKRQRNGGVSYSYFTSGGNTLDDVKENYWYYNSDNKIVWRGAFEGPTGTLVVIVDGVYQSGDGNDPYDYMSGSLWFMPWPTVQGAVSTAGGCYVKNGRLDCKNPSGPLTRCWDVSIGPYDCRFTVSDDSQQVTAVGNNYTESQYYKIAEFINLSKERTFKESY